MLKTVTFENVVHFKDKTIISLQSESKATSSSANSVNITGLNIFVGANFCGKSTVLELIRRCMTEEINVSVTNSYDKNLIAYAFCQFGLDGYDEVISGFIKEPEKESKVYKIFIFTDQRGIFLRLRSSDKSITYDGLVHTERDIEVIQSFFSKKDPTTNINLLDWIKLSRPREANIEDEPNWKTIEDKYVATLPLRGIGIVQWTRSEKIRIEHKENNYRMACERAEVISALLFDANSDEINKTDEERIFKYITHPEIFKFKKEEGLIVVQHYTSEDDDTPKKSPLLKTSEGILEAKLMSLLLAHKDIQTLCLEDPDRGMHPQMIERLKIMLYITSHKKTIILVTHSPYFVDRITIYKTHVFFRKKTTTNSYECSVTNTAGSKNLSKVSDIETLRTLLFSTKVLLVEGVVDKEVVEGIFAHVKRKALEKEAIVDFNKDITTYHVIPVHGCENTKKIASFCKYIKLTYLCLWDLDKVVRFDKKTHVIRTFEEIDNASIKEYEKYLGKPLSSFIDNDDSLKVAKLLESKRNTFIWRHGAIEDAILSSKNCNKEIYKSLNCKKLDSTGLKGKLKKCLHEGERKQFYAALVEVDEIGRFLNFIKEKEGMENEENHSKPRKGKCKISKNLQYVCQIFDILVIFGIIVCLFAIYLYNSVT